VRQLNKTLFDILNGNEHLDQSNKEQQLLNIERFFEFLLSLERMDLISKQIIFNTFVNLFECAPEDSLPSLFKMMEQKVFDGNINLADKDGNSSLILNMISRICKTIMRKLSVTHDTGFRGRV
jgi:hypothetical protein